jgi:hypothetical protein
MIEFLIVPLAIVLIVIAALTTLALVATGVVMVSGALAGCLGIAMHRLLPWIMLALGFAAMFFVNYAGAAENRRGSDTRYYHHHERRTNAVHDSFGDLLFGRMRPARGTARLCRVRFAPADAFGADLSASRYQSTLLPSSGQRAGAPQRISQLKRKRVTHKGPGGKGEDRPGLTLSGWRELTKVCIDLQKFMERRKYYEHLELPAFGNAK